MCGGGGDVSASVRRRVCALTSAERVVGASQALRRRPRRRTTSFVVSLTQLAKPVRLCRHHSRHPQFADLDQSLRRGGVSRRRGTASQRL